ncbi:hypothetical protein [Mesorhizobium sp. B2-3-5]|uniref:hypothetical protein n=1 Tax=Mesorhizobium sp. B2-3-5 TaxID=2589958 RepID=UPI00112C51B7|nr:hypothetical protein [Mesorhizobium sp. B2-3-5]TPM22651.1 hypothetical protein FJ958_24875 [Mesorhizobium sp. B2-3-5]
MQLALGDLRRGRPLEPEESVDLKTFEDVVRMSEWAAIENRFMGASHDASMFDKIKQKLTGG